MNRVQEIQLELMALSSFNGFDGVLVSNDLKGHTELWIAAVFETHELLGLRDIADGFWNADTVWIIPTAGKKNELWALASGWGADEVDWVGGTKACQLLGSYGEPLRSDSKALLRLWWD